METLTRLYTNFNNAFWSERCWLSRNSTWDMLQNKAEGPYSHIYYPQLSDMAWSFPASLLLLLVRYLFEKRIMKPLAGYCGLQKSGRTKRPENSNKLEHIFRKTKRPDQQEMERFASQVDWSLKKVQNWFRLKRNLEKSSKMKKFCECGWRFTFYFGALVGGLYVLYDEDFFYNWELAFDLTTWPREHHVRTEYFYYYVIEMGFYFSLMVSLFSDVRRSDFMQNCIHHVATIFLMVTSWSINFVRLGLLLLIIHDPADSWLEAAKMARYVGRKDLSNVLFVIFTIVWIATRTIAYPFYIVLPGWKTYWLWSDEIGYIFMINLCFMTVLVVLNLIWTVLILKTAHNGIKQDLQDARSGSESESEVSAVDELGDKKNEGNSNGLKNLKEKTT